MEGAAEEMEKGQQEEAKRKGNAGKGNGEGKRSTKEDCVEK